MIDSQNQPASNLRTNKGLHILGMKTVPPSQVVEGEVACKSSWNSFSEKSEYLFVKSKQKTHKSSCTKNILLLQ